MGLLLTQSDRFRAPEGVDVLAVLDFSTPFPVVFVVGGQASGIQSSSFRTETGNLKIKDGADVDVLMRPGPGISRPSMVPPHGYPEYFITRLNLEKFESFHFLA